MTDPLDRQPCERGAVIDGGSYRLHCWPMTAGEVMVIREPRGRLLPLFSDTRMSARIMALVDGRLTLRTEER